MARVTVTGVFTRRRSQGVGVTRSGRIEAAADRALALNLITGTGKSFFGGTGGGGGDNGNGDGSSKRQGRTASTQSKEPALGVEYASLFVCQIKVQVSHVFMKREF